MYQAFLIKYGEIGVKGKNRHIFEDTLVSQIGNALKPVEGTFTVRRENGRIYVETGSAYDYDEVVDALQCVFGIVGISPVVLAEDEGFDQLAELVVSYVGRAFSKQDFNIMLLLPFTVDSSTVSIHLPTYFFKLAYNTSIESAFPILSSFPDIKASVSK